MSTNELIRKFYHGSYKINSRGNFACPLYDENKSEDDQLCQFSVQNQGDGLTTEEFECFWLHVQTNHEPMYLNILESCRLKISNISKMNQFDKTFEIIGSTFVNLNKLVLNWSNSSMTSLEFIENFKSELASLEKQVTEIVKPITETTASPTSLSNF